MDFTIRYRDSQHKQHTCNADFTRLATFCAEVSKGTHDGNFTYKNHVPEKVMDQFLQYINNGHNQESRQKIITLDNVMYFNALARDLKCEILTEDCKSFVKSSPEINEINQFIHSKIEKETDRQAKFDYLMKKYKSLLIFAMFQDIVNPGSAGSSSSNLYCVYVDNRSDDDYEWSSDM